MKSSVYGREVRRRFFIEVLKKLHKKLFLLFICQCAVVGIMAQTTMQLNALSLFDSPGPAWQMAGNVHADVFKKEDLTATPGNTILVNKPTEKTPGKDLFTILNHGDADLELDYMMAKGSNSGIYLQGRYEVQLFDSWGVTNPRGSDNGGIYERWDDTRPLPQKGYEGHPPRQNAGRAPGLWQHLKISFQAPRFNAAGVKTSSARILSVRLNGVLIQENVELSGPTRGGLNNEVAAGPLRLQGDHGAIAFKNIKLIDFGSSRPNTAARENRQGEDVDPILINTNGNTIMRSFIDLPGGIRLTHSVSVGSDEQVHYTYDSDNGNLVQVWHGGFLDATPMWHDRGDGSSRPLGPVVYFGKPALFIQKLSTTEAAWSTDTTGSGFRQKGYVLDTAERPVFRYLLYGALVNDASSVMPEGRGIHREITVQTPMSGIYARLVRAPLIELLDNGMYVVGDNAFYVRIDDAGGIKPLVRDINGEKELIVPIQQKISYSILF